MTFDRFGINGRFIVVRRNFATERSRSNVDESFGLPSRVRDKRGVPITDVAMCVIRRRRLGAVIEILLIVVVYARTREYVRKSRARAYSSGKSRPTRTIHARSGRVRVSANSG